MSSNEGGAGSRMLWFRHMLGGSWVSVLWEKMVVSSFGYSIITFHMVITIARIMRKYNPLKVIAMMTWKSIFVS